MVKTSVARDEKRKTSLDETVIVSMEHVNKWFGEFHVLRDINLRVVRGERIVVCGPSGSGKSTLIKVLTGYHTPTKGKIVFEGQDVEINSPHDARELGIETVYQDLALVPLMSIARNFWLGQEPTYSVGPFKFLDKKLKLHSLNYYI